MADEKNKRRDKTAKNEIDADAARMADNIDGFKRRQSAPTPTLDGYAASLQASGVIPQDGDLAADEQLASGNPDETGAINGLAALDQPVKRETVQRARQILRKYKQGKANLEARIVEDEQWYKLRHWEQIRGTRPNEVEPTSAWLFNSLMNKHADAMDNFPSPTVLPREQADKEEAQRLSSIIPVILEHNDFEETYSDVWTYKLKTGTGVYGVFWDATKNNGIGDISVVKVDLLNLFWEPGITDIQKSPNLFHVELADNDELIGQFPQLTGKLTTPTEEVAKYVYDDTVDTSDKSAVVDWYYKRRVSGRTVLHYCKFVGDTVLYASENDPSLRERGWYDHGLYPFVFDPLFRVEGSPAGFGYIDVGRSPQEYIDRIGKAILENTLANTRPRHFVRTDGAVNEAEYADLTKDFVHVDGGGLDETQIRPIEGKQLSGIYYEVYQGKIDELKETTGNRDVNTGAAPSGITAASAVAALQEAGGKLSRDNSKAAYRAFRRIVEMIIELIRQFYTLPRQFRITGERGAEEYVTYSNERLAGQPYMMTFGDPELEHMLRKPVFDVKIGAQRASPYSKLSQNEMALSFYSAGMFDPMRADQALLCLDIMDFDGKDALMQKIAQNGIMYQQLSMAAAQGMAVDMDASPMRTGGAGTAAAKTETDAFGGAKAEEPTVTKKARQQAAERTNPT